MSGFAGTEGVLSIMNLYLQVCLLMDFRCRAEVLQAQINWDGIQYVCP